MLDRGYSESLRRLSWGSAGTAACGTKSRLRLLELGGEACLAPTTAHLRAGGARPSCRARRRGVRVPPAPTTRWQEDDRDPVPVHPHSPTARAARAADAGRKLAVRRGLSVRDSRELLEDRKRERWERAEIEREVEGAPLPFEVLVELAARLLPLRAERARAAPRCVRVARAGHRDRRRTRWTRGPGRTQRRTAGRPAGRRRRTPCRRGPSSRLHPESDGRDREIWS